MLDQLKVVSLSVGSPFLSYLIDMAKVEAGDEVARRTGPLSGEYRDPAARMPFEASGKIEL